MALSLKTVEAARGPRWIADAFRLFAKKPLAFTALFTVFLFGALVASLVPVLGALVQMMALPLLGLGFMVASQSALLGGPVHPKHFIEPLRTDAKRRRDLLVLCAIYGLLAIVILIIANELSGSAWGRLQALMAKGPEAQAEIDALMSEPGVASGALVAVVLGVALSIPFWHAPALVHWGGQGVAQALFSSTLAIWRSKAAFFAYGVGWILVIFIFAILTGLVFSLLGLGQVAGVLGVPAGLIFSAVFYISVLFSFNDSFGVTQIETLTVVGDDTPHNRD